MTIGTRTPTMSEIRVAHPAVQSTTIGAAIRPRVRHRRHHPLPGGLDAEHRLSITATLVIPWLAAR